MKFTVSVTIQNSREKVVQEFSNPENLKNWQEGFLRIEHLQGEPGKNGSTAYMYYKFGKGEMEIKETIKENNLPNSFAALYEHKHMVNTMISRFTALNKNKTLYESEVEYTKFNGFLPKLMAALFPGMFKKQVLKWMNNLKTELEKK